MTDVRSGYLLLADISGHTAFLSDAELEHAREILTDLIGVVIDHTRPPLALSKLEGWWSRGGGVGEAPTAELTRGKR